MMYETILSPIHYGGMQLKNRIIFAPTTFGLSDEEYLAKIRAIAQGGCAMIIVGDVPVGKSKFEKLVLENKIKLFESIIPFLLEENRQKAIDEIKTLKLHLLKY